MPKLPSWLARHINATAEIPRGMAKWSGSKCLMREKLACKSQELTGLARVDLGAAHKESLVSPHESSATGACYYLTLGLASFCSMVRILMDSCCGQQERGGGAASESAGQTRAIH
jgi:hypothetical protein